MNQECLPTRHDLYSQSSRFSLMVNTAACHRGGPRLNPGKGEYEHPHVKEQVYKAVHGKLHTEVH